MQLGITDQVRLASQKQFRLAAIVGAVLGGFVPLAVYWLAHFEASLESVQSCSALVLVLAGLAYSATTVYGWARVAFGHPVKALGFVVLLEGAMSLSRSAWLSALALVILVSVNAIATACALAADQRQSRSAERAAAARAKPQPKAAPVVRLVRKSSPAGKVARKGSR